MKKSNTGITTDPLVVKAIIENIRDRWNCEINIVESDATTNNLEAAFSALGWRKIAKDLDVNLINLSRDNKVKTDFKGLCISKPKIAKTLKECDLLISVPKLKAHEITGITGVLKNQFGCLSRRRKVRYHPNINEAIVDAATIFKPHLSIVDAIITNKGGVMTGTPIISNLILAGTDPVALDSASAKIIGLNPHRIKHLEIAERLGLGSRKFILKGDVDKIRVLNLYSPNLLDKITSLFVKTTSRGA